MSTEEIKSLVQQATQEIWGERNADVADKYYTADHLRHDPTQPEPIEGVDAMKARLRTLFNAFPDAQVDVKDMVVEGNTFANRWVMTGTHEGEFNGIPATGKPVRMSGMSLGKVRDGKIAEVWDELNIVGLMQQLGVTPQSEQS
ncbi:MAG: ester cyclase [Anaerolineales bacterium]